MIDKRVVSKNFDLPGVNHGRLLRLAIFGRIFPLGNLCGGPGRRCVVILGLLYTVGGVLYSINARYGDRLVRVKAMLRRLRG